MWRVPTSLGSNWESLLDTTVGTVILLVLNDFVTRHTEYYGLALGIIILVFALGLRRGLLDVLIDLWHRHSAFARAGVKAGNASKASL